MAQATAMALTPEQVARRQVRGNSELGRFSAPELFFSTNQAITQAGGRVVINPNIPINLTRAIESIEIRVSMRVVVSVAPYTAVAPESPQNFVQIIQLQGNHRTFGAITPVYLSGATAYAMGAAFQSSGNSRVQINGVDATAPSVPFLSPFTGAVGNHDIEMCINVPVAPMMGVAGQSAKKQTTNFLLQPLDWGNTLQIQLLLGDDTSLGDSTGATVAFQGPGGVGNPLISIQINYALLGSFQNQFTASGVVVKNEQRVQMNQTVAANNILLQQLAHQITNSVLVKTGTTQAAVSASVDTLATLSDVQLDFTQLQVDNKPIRNNQNNFAEKSYLNRMFNTFIPQGYFNLTFMDGQNSLLAYRGDRLPGGSQFNLTSNVLTNGATQTQRVVQEYVVGGPYPA